MHKSSLDKKLLILLLSLKGIFILRSSDSVRCHVLDDLLTFHCIDYLVIGGIAPA